MVKQIQVASPQEAETFAKRIAGSIAGNWDRDGNAQAKIGEYLKRLKVPEVIETEVRQMATKMLAKQGIY